MSYGPPSNPTDGQEWKSGRDRYRFQPGKGWVDAALYRPPAPPPPPEPVRPPKAAKAPPAPRLCACGATMGRFAKRCRACYFAAKRAKAMPRVERHCVGCGKPCTGERCRPCHTAHLLSLKPPAPPPPAPKWRPDPAEAERVRRAAERLEQQARLAEASREVERAADRQSERVVVKVPASVPRPVDPLAKKERTRPHVPAKDPLDSDAFRAQLAKVAAGARIVTERPVSKRVTDGRGGSSLTNF